MSFLFPILLNLEGKRCLVAGQGRNASAKARSLREAGAEVVVVEPAGGAVPPIDGYFLVAAASDDSALHRLLFEAAERRGILFQAVDDPAHSRFISPAVHRQGDLVLAVSTGGKSPALAARLRDRFARELGPEYARFLQLLGDLRPLVRARHPDPESRRLLWLRAIDSPALSLVRDGDEQGARELLTSILNHPER